MKTSWTAQELEDRRMLAVERVNQGCTQVEVAKVLGVDPRSVRRWMKAYRDGGTDALRAQPRPGRPPHLNAEQTQTVLGWFRQRPTALGFATELWTAKRVAHLIQKQFGVSFNHRYLNAWLTDRAITPQKPQRRARERDQARIDRWVAQEWPRILKKGLNARPTSCWSMRPVS
jgi:transposase